MADGFKPIPRCKEGDTSLISSDYANQLIDLLNAIGSGTVAPILNVGSFKAAGGQFILDLSPLDKRVRALEAGSGGNGIASWPMMLMQANNNAVIVTPATVSGLIPNGINTPINIGNSSSTWNIYLWATLQNNGIPSAVNIVATTGNVPASDSNNAYHLIGQASVSNGNITGVSPILAWSQTFVTCGRNSADTANTPGTYYWLVS